MSTGTAHRPSHGDFVGRGQELARLADLATKVRAGQHQTAVIQGAAGIGKSSLVRHFVNDLTDFVVLSATGDPAESQLELGLIDQLLAQTPADIRARTASLGRRTPAGANPLAIGSQLLELLGEIQQRSPVALVIDDIQWADRSSLQALRFLLRRMWVEQFLVVLVTRTGTDQSTDTGLERLVRGVPADLELELTGLDLVDVSDLARTIAGHRLPTSAARRYHSFTGGHPLLLRTMLTEISSQPSGVDWRLAVPPSVTAAIRRSFEKLPEASRSLLEAMAVLGGRPSLAQAATVAGLEAAQQALGPAIDAGLASWSPSEPTCPVAITHDLQREAIYSALSPLRRSQLHQRAATTVEPFLAWRHRVSAVSTTDAALAAQLEKAAADEAENGDHGTAATFLSWAAELAPWSLQKEKLQLTSMIHLLFSSDRGRARLLHERATRCAPSALRSLALGLCELYITGERSKAEANLLHAFAADDSTESWVRGSAAAGLTGISVWRGDADDALMYADLALRASGVPAPLRDYVGCLRGVARGRRDGLLAGLEEFRHLSEHPSDISTHDLEALSCRGSLRTMVGLIEEARGDLLEVVRRQEAGAPMLSGVTPHCYLAAVQYQLGEWDACQQTMRRAALLADDDQPAMNQVIRYFVASLVPAARGDWDTADDLVRAATTAAQQLGGPQDMKYAAIAAASLCQARNDPRGALRALSAVPGLRTATGAPGGTHEWWSTWWGPLLIDVLQQTGQLVESARELAALRERAHGSTILASTVTRLAAQQADAEGNQSRAVAIAEDQLATASDSRPRLADGQLQHAHGRRLLATGNISAATRWLTTANHCFTALSAIPYQLRAASDLAALTSEPHPRPLPHLTTREQQIVDLVLRNFTNREIAATLFVTQKTVEYHLSNIFTKLSIRSRRDLHRLI
ncbi:helix-turn-helix transcriptional regulator [Kribbella monticola]|uniref:helix-turn-helix transcriptional regulator n=1 Tax=Kribbella monticola TaxID=2185285 RepID=UPI000DD3FEFD|nr:LuxR family transcriptional regulator [Kribbella monticola]